VTVAVVHTIATIRTMMMVALGRHVMAFWNSANRGLGAFA
jgi:hypothetical protein